MATTQTFALASKILKELYVGQPVKDLTYPELPFYAMVPKDEEMSGIVYPLPIKWADTVGASATFSNAQANTAPAKYSRFALDYSQKYQTALIEGKAIRTTKNDKGAFVNLFTATNDSTVKGMARAIAVDLMRSQYGVIGRIASTATVSSATTWIALDNPSDAVNLEVGMILNGSAEALGASLKSGTATVSAVDVDNGQFKVSVAWNSAISSGAASDYIYRDGDATLNLKGLSDWCPSTAPTAGEDFFSVDRSVHTRLYGTYYDGSGAGTVEEAVYRLLTMSSKKGGHITDLFLNDIDFGNLEMSLASKVVIEAKASDAEIFFEGIRLRGPKGPVGVFADNTVPQGHGFGVPMAACKLCSVGPAVALLDEDGNQWLRQTSSDGYEIRYGFLGQFGCEDTNSLGHVLLPTT